MLSTSSLLSLFFLPAKLYEPNIDSHSHRRGEAKDDAGKVGWLQGPRPHEICRTRKSFREVEAGAQARLVGLNMQRVASSRVNRTYSLIKPTAVDYSRL